MSVCAPSPSTSMSHKALCTQGPWQLSVEKHSRHIKPHWVACVKRMLKPQKEVALCLEVTNCPCLFLAVWLLASLVTHFSRGETEMPQWLGPFLGLLKGPLHINKGEIPK